MITEEDKDKLIATLTLQLQEQEKEIKTMQESSDKNIDYLIEFASLIEDQKDCNRMLKALERVRTGKKYIVNKEHQDKISFAVEQLEKVKEFVIENESWEIEGSDYSIVYADDVLDKIDNQINALRNNKDGIH